MAEEGKVSFKKSAKKRPARSKAEESPSEDEEINTTDFEKTKQLQRLRKRTAGTNIVTLALGKKISKVRKRRNFKFYLLSRSTKTSWRTPSSSTAAGWC